jgi:hypothetical protein
VQIVELPGLPEKGDVSDWIAGGGTKAELERLAKASPPWTPTPEPWPGIVPFDRFDLPGFPTDALPVALRNWVESESRATQTPPDLAGTLALAVVAATIARRVEVEPRPGWREPVNLYVTILLEPGNRKSAVFTDATSPLQEIEEELIEAERPGLARQQSERRQDEARLKKLERTAGEKNDAAARSEAATLAGELAQRPEAVLPRLIVDDATSEKLGIMLAEQGGRLASMSAEGGVFDLMAGRYSKNGLPQLEVYLKGHSGDDLRTDRVGRKSVSVKRPALTCAYTMQLQVIRGLTNKEAFRGRGVLARYLYAAPQSWIGHREIAPKPVSKETSDTYRRAIRSLHHNFGNIGSASDQFVLRLTPEAAARFEEWEREIEAMLADGGQMELMRDWGGKLAGATLRIAAVLHCVEHGRKEHITEQTIAAAIKIAGYFVPHAEAVLSMMEAKDASVVEDAHYVLRWIRRHDRREFTKSEAQHHGKRRFPQADDIDPALEELKRRGHIRLRPTGESGRGRPPSPTYEVNPVIFDNSNPEKRSQYSRNSAEPPDDGISGNIGSAPQTSENTNRVQVTL